MRRAAFGTRHRAVHTSQLAFGLSRRELGAFAKAIRPDAGIRIEAARFGQVPNAKCQMQSTKRELPITLRLLPRLSLGKRQGYRSFPAPIRIQNSGWVRRQLVAGTHVILRPSLTPVTPVPKAFPAELKA